MVHRGWMAVVHFYDPRTYLRTCAVAWESGGYVRETTERTKREK